MTRDVRRHARRDAALERLHDTVTNPQQVDVPAALGATEQSTVAHCAHVWRAGRDTAAEIGQAAAWCRPVRCTRCSAVAHVAGSPAGPVVRLDHRRTCPRARTAT